MIVGREAARLMVPRSRGTIQFTGGLPSRRAGAKQAAFAVGKFGLRAVAQSMARELAPKGIHVSHFVIEGMINNQRMRKLELRRRQRKMGWFRQKRWPINIIKSIANQKVAGLSRSMFDLGKTRSRPA